VSGLGGAWLSIERRTVPDLVADARARYGPRPYLDFSGEVFTYDEIWDRSCRVASGLAALGVGRGDTVVALLDSHADAVAVWYGANMLGAIWVPTNTAYKGEFLRHQVSDSGARVVIAETDYAERLLEVAAGTPEVTTVVHRGAAAPAGSAGGLTLRPFEDLLSAEPLAEARPVEASELSMLVYTSGTTGPSKGCMMSHNYIANVAVNSLDGRREGDVIWTPLPLFHLNASATTVLATALQGNKACIYPRFSLRAFWSEMRRTGATLVTLLGAMIPLIARLDDSEDMLACKGQIRKAGGAPYPPEIARVYHERFGVEAVGSSVFGLTETTFLTRAPLDEPIKPGTAGKLTDDFDVRIFDDEDNELPVGTAGEVVARPRRPHVMFEGYWNGPEATQSVMRNMWFHTGDIGRFDEEGWLYFVDRKKDYLRRRGENISSQEVESTFHQHPDITEVAVHAVPSEFTEDDLKVTVVLREGAAVTEEDLCRWSIDRLPYFAVPRYVEFRAELPKNPMGKIRKFRLREEGATTATWDRESVDIELSRR
jgi:crotonobetaine/carnitine-CoA ligase